jgi:hypothetical protein
LHLWTAAYRQRNHVERTVNRLKGWRRVATRDYLDDCTHNLIYGQSEDSNAHEYSLVCSDSPRCEDRSRLLE